MKPLVHTALFGASLLLTPASGTILLNEININPPSVPDLNYEFIELRSTTNGVEPCTGLTLLIIENNGGQVGQIEEALNLNDYSTGVNGLLMLGNGYISPPGGRWSDFKAPSTAVADPSGTAPYSGLGDDDIDPNGGLTFLLVSGYRALTNANSTSLGDVDVDNNSVLDWLQSTPPSPALNPQLTQPWTTLVDSIGYRDLDNNPFRLPYTTADLNVRQGSAATFAPDNISRRLSRAATPGDQNNSGAWYGGNLAGVAGNAISYDIQFFGDFKGQATPGQANLDAAPVVGNFVINEVSINPSGDDDGNYEFVEILNAGGGAASLQGLALVLVQSYDGGLAPPAPEAIQALGTITEAWDLSTFTTGANGLLLLGNNYPDGDLPWAGYLEQETQVGDPVEPAGQPLPPRWSGMGDRDIGSNNGFTLLLVQNYTGKIGDDLDTNNDGTLDLTPWTTLKDSVGFNQVSPGIGKTYATAKITSTPAYEVDNLSRKLGDISLNSAAAWYGGDYGGKSSFSIGFKDDTALPLIGGFRGSATPGRVNLNAAALPVPVRINEVQVDPVADPDDDYEYLELSQTSPVIGTLNGMSLVVANGLPGAQNGRITVSVDLSGYSTGPNGLMIIGDGYEDSPPYDIPGLNNDGLISPLTAREDPDGINKGDFGEGAQNNGLIFLITKGPKPAINTNIADIPAANIVDSIGFGTSPNPAVTMLAPGFVPDNVSRYPGDLAANSASSWYSGELDASQGGVNSLYYSSSYAGTYKGGASPGRFNHAATPISTATLLLNELNINPPGGDDNFEFIEFRSRPAAAVSTNGFTLLQLDSAGSNTGTVMEAWSLDGLATGANGLLLTGAGYPAPLPWTGTNAPAPTTGFGSPMGMAPGDIAGTSDNGAVSFLLVRGFNGRVGQDLDVSPLINDGVIDVIAPWAEPIDDAVAMKEWDTSATLPALAGTIYGGVDLSQTGYTPDNVSRRGDNAAPSSELAWYGGDISGTVGTSTTFDPSQNFRVEGFEGMVTPGQPNAGTALSDIGDEDNDSVVNLIEYALSMNPLVSDTEKLPQTSTVEVGGVVYPTLSYTRFINGSGTSQVYTANGFRYEVEASPDLLSWNGSVSPVSVTPNSDGLTETAVLRPETIYFAGSMASSGRIFLRLKITRL